MSESDKSMYVRTELVEQKVEDIDKRVNRLEDNQASLDRISTVTEMHIKEIQRREQKQELREEKQDIMLGNLSSTLTNMTTTLTSINLNLDRLNSGQDDLERRIGKIEDNNKIDVPALIKQIIWIGLPTIAIAAVMLWLGLK